MGIQNNGKGTDRRDIVLTDVRKRSGYLGRSWAHELQGAQPDENKNDEAMRLQLDLVDELRTTAKQRLTRYQDRVAKYYNSRVRHRDFQVGDLVLRKVIGAARGPTQGKLSPNLEGPYRVALWQRKDTYHLETLEGQKLPHPWNTEHLRKYYQ